MYRRKQPFKVQTPKKFTLNITSMADMFTILLVFLLQSYSVSEFKLDPTDELQLPVSAAFKNPTKSEQIILSNGELRLGDKVLTSVDKINPHSRKIDSLYQALISIKQSDAEATWVQNGEIILQADRSQTYANIQKVMYTASVAGFPKLKLATLSGE